MRWCKQRALEYLNRGQLVDAVTSMLSDLGKHDETRHLAGSLSMLGLIYAHEHDVEGVRRFIEGFAE